MEEEIQLLIKELHDENDKLTKQLTDKPDMIWTYKSAKMSTKAVNTTVILKLKKILETEKV